MVILRYGHGDTSKVHEHVSERSNGRTAIAQPRRVETRAHRGYLHHGHDEEDDGDLHALAAWADDLLVKLAEHNERAAHGPNALHEIRLHWGVVGRW